MLNVDPDTVTLNTVSLQHCFTATQFLNSFSSFFHYSTIPSFHYSKSSHSSITGQQYLPTPHCKLMLPLKGSFFHHQADRKQDKGAK